MPLVKLQGNRLQISENHVQQHEDHTLVAYNMEQCHGHVVNMTFHSFVLIVEGNIFECITPHKPMGVKAHSVSHSMHSPPEMASSLGLLLPPELNAVICTLYVLPGLRPLILTLWYPVLWERSVLTSRVILWVSWSPTQPSGV